MAAFRKSLLFIIVLLSAIACGILLPRLADSESESSDQPTPSSLTFMFFGDKPTDMEKVLKEFENRTRHTLNLSIHTEWDSPEEYKQKVRLRLAAGEEIDAVFDASWMNIENNVAQGYYQVLDHYFNNDDYPGLKKAFTAEYLDANKIDGHIYAVPITQFFHDIEVVFIRKDLREKFDMQPLQSYGDLEQYLQQVVKSEKSMIPFALKGDRGFFRLFANEDVQSRFRAAPSAIPGTGVNFEVILSEDGKKVLGAVTLGDPDDMYASFPQPYNNPSYFYNVFDRFVEWNRYIQKDVLNERNALLLFEAGKTAAVEGTITNWSEIAQKLKTAVKGAEMEGFVYKACQRSMEKGCIGTDYRAWNNLAIPVTSGHADETMKFLDWIFQSQENHDLFELGIEGEHWMKGEGMTYTNTSDSPNYSFPPFELTWNPSMSRINVDNDPEAMKLLQYSADPESYYRLPITGFTFNPAPVKNEIAKIQPLATQMSQVFNSGLDPNWRETASQTNGKLKVLGLDKIREELIRQVQYYLDSQKMMK